MTLRNLFKNSFSALRRVNFTKNKCEARLVSSGIPALNKKEIEVTFIKSDGERIKAKGKIGDSLLDVVVNSQLPLDGFGACEGTLTCSTCHLIFKKEDYEQLPDQPSGEEIDMLELAYETGPTSRLGCQVILSEKLDGLEVRVPESINDIRGD